MDVDPETLRDWLFDLEHDLGKYVALPLNMLAADADAAAFRAAVHRGLHETRRGPAGVQSARLLWAAFTERAAPALRQRGLWNELAACVEKALHWGDVTEQAADRAMIVADLRAVAPAIREVLRRL